MNTLVNDKKQLICKHCGEKSFNVYEQTLSTGYSYEKVNICLNCKSDHDTSLVDAVADAQEFSGCSDYYRQFGVYK